MRDKGLGGLAFLPQSSHFSIPAIPPIPVLSDHCSYVCTGLLKLRNRNFQLIVTLPRHCPRSDTGILHDHPDPYTELLSKINVAVHVEHDAVGAGLSPYPALQVLEVAKDWTAVSSQLAQLPLDLPAKASIAVVTESRRPGARSTPTGAPAGLQVVKAARSEKLKESQRAPSPTGERPCPAR